ncbi:hypothetical protein WCD74_15405 [Actinomycetospora sp. OC33-EN08]|uniref:Uncharacterized protein n=1 Tax=Actinomycetospora aurantiaca TaxID=3129233 RepID=A0ABU8MR73_9PSEU
MADAVVVRLVGGPDHPGELDAAGLRGLLAAVQLVSTRVARYLVDQARPGRSAGVVERAARIRLVGLDAEGTATVLRFAVGEEGVLGDGLEHEVTDALFELVRGLWNERPPPWTTPLLGEACVDLLDALARVARTAAFGGARFREVSFAPAALSRDEWPREDAPRRYGETATVRGRLDRVDLRRRVLRVLDETGADVVVESVLAGYDVEGDPLVAAARLLGSEVVVSGPASRGPGGLRLRGATVRPA